LPIGGKNETKRKVSLYEGTIHLGPASEFDEFVWFKAPQYRKRAVFTKETGVEKKFADRSVEKIRDEVPVKVDYKDPAPRNSCHLAKDLDHLLLNKVMCKERTDDVIELTIYKR